MSNPSFWYNYYKLIYNHNNQQVLITSITWTQLADVPVKMSLGKTAVINGKVYYGGGKSSNTRDNYYVHCYDPTHDTWTTLPKLPVRQFSLSSVNNNLVVVGGIVNESTPTNKVHTYDKKSKKWKQTIPPMPTARYTAGVAKFNSTLIVAGGNHIGETYTDAVEIYDSKTSQWYSSDPLPTPSSDISLVVVGEMLYALGGEAFNAIPHNQVLSAPINNLIRKAILANQEPNIDTQVEWKSLRNTHKFKPAATMLTGKLFSLGGTGRHNIDGSESGVFMYSPGSDLWIHVFDLPVPLSHAGIVATSVNEFIVIGGWMQTGPVKLGSISRSDTVFKGELKYYAI